MCGRFTLITPLDEVARLFQADLLEADPPPPRYNIAPTQPVAVVRPAPPDAGEDAPQARARARREVVLLRWGLLPSWAADPADFPTLINARAETLDRKPAFQDAVRERRCLVPADGFYEWRAENGKQPYYVRATEGGLIALAGLWERWTGPGGEAVESVSIVTTDANELLRPIHERMPVILAAEARDRWLDPAVRRYRDLRDLLRPLPSDLLEAYPVSRQVNRADVEDPRNVEPLEDVEAEPPDDFEVEVEVELDTDDEPGEPRRQDRRKRDEGRTRGGGREGDGDPERDGGRERDGDPQLELL